MLFSQLVLLWRSHGEVRVYDAASE